MTHTIVQLKSCSVELEPEEIVIVAGEHVMKISYDEFEEILEAVARTKKFTEV
jgi:hypothetical protein